jgi:hypothetical protein
MIIGSVKPDFRGVIAPSVNFSVTKRKKILTKKPEPREFSFLILMRERAVFKERKIAHCEYRSKADLSLTGV